QQKNHDGSCSGAEPSQEEDRNQAHDHQLRNQCRKELPEGCPDPGGSVVGWNDLDTGRKGCGDFLQLSIQCSGNGQDVLVLFHDDDAAHNLASPVEIHGAPALVVSNLDVSDVAEVDRPAFLVTAENQILELIDVFAVDRAPQLVVAVGNLNHASAGLLKDILKSTNHLLERDASIHEQRRKDFERILLFQTYNRRHFPYSRNRL